ncbi:hypothetical protein PanWU01x14_253970 [Parasponia andersonii]|uniref:Uncharacterized protein n=1 Tax=Parasponia andersonii TaxID=3476 RepID=A0A2P5BBB1_PARAD|nr:hypothetical protein PanWU01x14_253970 [Parasponia andersonii]
MGHLVSVGRVKNCELSPVAFSLLFFIIPSQPVRLIEIFPMLRARPRRSMGCGFELLLRLMYSNE